MEPKSTQTKVSRRSFFWTTAAAAASMSWTAKSYGRILGANDRIGIGFIGAGGMAANHMRAYNDLKESNNLLALAVADCWKSRADEGASTTDASLATLNYHEVLDSKQVDYVVIATPEHQHAQMTLDAFDAGKAVYCEKPMTHTIPEALSVWKKQAETELPLQVGVQGMSDDSYSSANQAIQGGVIGQVVQAQIEYVRRYGSQGLFCVPDLKDDLPKPPDLDWKAWLGPAPNVEWNPHHYFEWRNFSMYSGGIAGDLFVHRITRMIRALDLHMPRRVVGMGGIWQWPENRDLPDNFEMICEYPEGLTVYVLGTQSNRVDFDHLIRGYRGTLYFTNDGWVAKDKDGKILAEHKKTGGEDVNLHHTNLHNHMRNGEPLNCPVRLGFAGMAASVMANESWRTGQMMGWDPESEKMVPCQLLEHDPYPAKERS
ncbi:Gfo/Idh/MocA family protein [Bythopirellula goksoeyrii]|uniref:Inositol 2-dehydrogenase n=1 Tax=Bythopirellula goksoeyrii TaxID=1400387 RepID=A0A5B9Q785_9BACT|nr:Gfo/Idh/MocA family oxidoreductase [Bythopirellula goksoeyrii]QEG33405.1 Inositol 2-dehydrogenase [Bythopirellula goksoeyrii]